MEKFAVIDTETNWNNEVMSIGVVVADAKSFDLIDKKYYIIAPEYLKGGMFFNALRDVDSKLIIECNRANAIANLVDWFEKHGVISLYAYNATFDYSHLPELSMFRWFDIMRLAAYRQYNPKIKEADCCRTGRLIRNYGVESILKLLNGDERYCETHNALNDAADELLIMKLLQHSPEEYIELEKSRRCQALNEAAVSESDK